MAQFYVPVAKTAGESTLLPVNHSSDQQQHKGKKREGGICFHEVNNNANGSTCYENKKRSKRTTLGYRFHPTDQELITLFLRKKLRNNQVRFRDVHDVNIYLSTPQELADKFKPGTGGNKWYFFSSRDRKYPKGKRPSRATGHGFWKATGRDIHITDKDNITIGCKNALVYYQGDHKKSTKTNWIMHEYKVSKEPSNIQTSDSPKDKLLDMVLCRIYENIQSPGKNSKKAPEDDVYQDIPQDSQSLQIYDTAPAPIAAPTTGNYDHYNVYHNPNLDIAKVPSQAQQTYMVPAPAPAPAPVPTLNNYDPYNVYHDPSQDIAQVSQTLQIYGTAHAPAPTSLMYDPYNSYHYPGGQVIPQVSHALQVYDNIINNSHNDTFVDGTIGVTHNENTIVEQSPESLNVVEDDFQQLLSTTLAFPLDGQNHYDDLDDNLNLDS